VHQKRDVLDYPARTELLHAIEKESTEPDSALWRCGGLGESKVSAGPLLYKCGSKGAGEAEKEAERPQNIDMDSIAFRSKRFVGRRSGHGGSIGDCSKLLCSLSKNPCGYFTIIGLEELVAFHKKCGNCSGEHTSLNGRFERGE
jgi:hypothetical protein